MRCSDEYEQYLENEIARCGSLHAFCQEMASLANSEMTSLEYRQQQLLCELNRLREARALYLPHEPSHDQIIHQLTHMHNRAYTAHTHDIPMHTSDAGQGKEVTM